VVLLAQPQQVADYVQELSRHQGDGQSCKIVVVSDNRHDQSPTAVLSNYASRLAERYLSEQLVHNRWCVVVVQRPQQVTWCRNPSIAVPGSRRTEFHVGRVLLNDNGNETRVGIIVGHDEAVLKYLRFALANRGSKHHEQMSPNLVRLADRHEGCEAQCGPSAVLLDTTYCALGRVGYSCRSLVLTEPFYMLPWPSTTE